MVKLNLSGAILYGTYLGGTIEIGTEATGAGVDIGYGVAVDSNGDAYVAGLTTTTSVTHDFPVLNPYCIPASRVTGGGSQRTGSSYAGGRRTLSSSN
ncbi:MAG: hypothetical protein C4287_22950 [Leptolyngbya sp. ERB_1_2]